MKKYKNKSMYLALAVILFLIGVGYAVLTSNLTITGTSGIANATWDVHFENPQATANSSVIPSIAPAADPDDKVQSISYTVTFNEPGDVYEFTVDVANRGSIDAMINSITSTYQIGEATPVDLTQNDPPAYLDYYVIYSDGTELAQKQKLVHSTTEELLVHVEFKRNITNAQFEGAVGKSIVFTYGLEYVQTNGSEIAVRPPICRRATTLHTVTCSRTDGNGCNATGQVGNGNEIIYGNDPATRTSGELQPGDAFDCDVNGDGMWDAEAERFYYVADEGNNAVLIYYGNVTNDGTTLTAPVQTNFAYYETKHNWHGPAVAYQQLPNLSQWRNPQLIAPGTRQITNESGTDESDTTEESGGPFTIELFTYTNKAARLLTFQEVKAACGSRITETGDLNDCNYLMESIGQFDGTSGTFGYLLETPSEFYNDYVWTVYSSNRNVNFTNTNWGSSFGVRPAITVLKTNISY